MIQLTWLELIIFLFSATVCGAVIFSFFIQEQGSQILNHFNLDEELIGGEARRRLQAYDREETTGNAPRNEKMNDQFSQLSNQIRNLETQIRDLKLDSDTGDRETGRPSERKSERPGTEEKKSVVHSISEKENYNSESEAENSKEDDFLQAKEELELALFKAKRQLSRYQTSMQTPSQHSSSEPNSNLHDELFRNELEKTTQLIEQLYLSFQKNPHTSYSLQQMKQRVLKEMDLLSEHAQKIIL